MATDPTKSIQSVEHESAFALRADEMLERLADLPPQYEVPYLTISLNWTVEGNKPGQRIAEIEVANTLKQIIETQEPRSAALDALIKSRERIEEWLNWGLQPAASGVYIVSHEPSGVFEATGLTLPVETNVTLSPAPAVYTLARLIEDYPTYAVLQADQATAELSLFSFGAIDRSAHLASSLSPSRVKAGGLNQARYQRRADERVEAFARDTIDQVERALREVEAEVLIVVASEVMLTALQHAMSGKMKGILYETLRMDSLIPEHELLERTLPLAEQAEREREQDSVTRLKDAIGHGRMGVAGAADTLRALQIGQVHMLVMTDTFAGDGWADYEMHTFGTGPTPREHPAGGDVSNLVDVNLREEMMRLAIATDATFDIIHSTPGMDGEVRKASSDMPLTEAASDMVQMGGVGAVLRYAMDGDAPQSKI